MSTETWHEQDCPDDAPDGSCWDCRAPRTERHRPGCPRDPLPRYTGAIIYACPECWGDLQHEGASDYWCPACRQSFHFTQIGYYDDGDLDD